MDIFGEKYNYLPGDEKKRKLNANMQIIDSWEGNLSSEDLLLKNQRDISELVPERKMSHLKWLYLITIMLFLVLTARLWQLQIVQGAESLKKAEGNTIHVKTVYAPRGVIYDRQGKIIAGNVSRYDLKVVPALLPDDKSLREKNYLKLSSIANIDPKQLIDQIDKEGISSWHEIIIAKNLERNIALVLKTKNFPGFSIENISSRNYYCDQECSHFIGYTGQVSSEELEKNESYQAIDQVGRAGLESYYEKQLKGTNGAEYRIVDASGQTTSVLTPKQSKSGNNLTVTVDNDLQKLAYDKLSEISSKNNQVTGGALVATNPNNGEIISLVSFPSFSANKFTNGLTQEEYDVFLKDEKLPLFDRTISGEYPPGSTFKIITSAAILNEKITSPDTYIVDQGSIRIVNKYDPSIIYIFYSWDHAGLGRVNMVDALALSSDIYFYIFGGGFEDYNGLGIKKLQQNAEKFMISKTLGIDLYGERPGFIPTPEWKQKVKNEEWYLGDDYNAAIGQGDILATPLQVNAYTSAIANGGQIYKPHLLREITDSSGKKIITAQPEVISSKIITPENLAIIKQGMEEVVSRGTAKMMQSASVKVAGKTGTAQYANNTKEHAWFTCYAPADNPQIALTVFVEGGGEGSESAVPIALEYLNYYFSHKK